MVIAPGVAVNCGDKSKPRKGSILAVFTGPKNELFIASSAHVISGNKPIKSVQLRSVNGRKIADYHSGRPKKKLKYVDFLIGSFETDVEWSNQVVSTDVKLVGIAAPYVGQELRLMGRNGSYQGQVSKILAGGRYRYSFAIECIGNRPEVGDSGAPWFTKDGQLVGIHTAALSDTAVRAHQLVEVIDHYKLTVA